MRRATPDPRRLLTIGHSYVVGLNRRLADELAKTGEWDVTVVAPARFRGDFGWHEAKAMPDERCALAPVPVYFAGRVHLMLYGAGLARLLRAQPWDLVHCWEEPYVAAARADRRGRAARRPARVRDVPEHRQAVSAAVQLDRAPRAPAAPTASIAFGQTIADVLGRRGFAGRAHTRDSARRRHRTLRP